MSDPFHPKQIEFILNATRKYNLAHGSVSTGKTVCALFAFLKFIHADCPGDSIFIIGYSLTTIYQNVVALLFHSPELKFFANYCNWHKGEHVLMFGPKRIKCIGAGDEGALGIIQGLTMDACMCDEMTLYPDNVIDMIDTRLRREHSRLYATMNPKQPDHKLKKWVDRATDGDPLYYALHFKIEDNTFLPASYKENLRKNLSGLFYKRYYLGEWCQAEGAVYDQFDRAIHVRKNPPCAADYYIVGIDYGVGSVFAAVLIGVSLGRQTQTGLKMWAEKEYYWNVKETARQKTNTEYARDLQAFLDGYPLRGMYIDPSATAFILEMRRAGFQVVLADNDVLNGIQTVSNFFTRGTFQVLIECVNLIREIESYVWDSKKAKIGEDAPMKQNDHAADAIRYALFTHKVPFQTPNDPNFGSALGKPRPDTQWGGGVNMNFRI